MARDLSATAFPESEQALEQLLEAEFQRLTGFPVTHAAPVFLAKYDHGGMSSGGVSPQFWRETGIPVLVDLYRAMNYS